MQEDKAKEVVKKLQENSYTAYFCGGCVRDKLLGKKPKDYDIVTNATPEQIKKIFPHTVEIGIKFGIICIKYKGEFFEIATFRKDGDYQDGRRPEKVDFADDKEDAYRRDFTINGLFYDPIAEKTIDYVCGEKDIQGKIIRTIGLPNDRFGEDYLRLMRAIRFAAQLNFSICPETWKSIQQKSSHVQNVSKERRRDEILSMFKSPHPQKAFDLLIQSQIWSVIFPQLKNEPEQVKFTQQILQSASPIATDHMAITIAFFYFFLFDHQDKISLVCDELMLPNATQKFIVDIFSNYPQIFEAKNFDLATLKKFLRHENFNALLTIHNIDCTVRNISLEHYNFCKEKFILYEKELFPEKVFTGNDLKKIGIPPGPMYKIILEDIENKQLANNLNNYAEIAKYVQETYAGNNKFDKKL